MAISELPRPSSNYEYKDVKPLSKVAANLFKLHVLSLELRNGNESRLQHPAAIQAKNEVIRLVSEGRPESLSFIRERKEGVFCEFDVNVEGAENIPSEGPFIIISNHYNRGRLCGLNQGSVMCEVMARALPEGEWLDYRFIVSAEKGLKGLVKASKRTPLEIFFKMADSRYRQISKEIMTNFIAAWGCIPTGLEGTKRLLSCLENGDIIGLYPTGVDEYQLHEVDPRAGKLIDLVGNRLGDVAVLPIGYWMDLYKGTYQMRIGRPFYSNEKRRRGLNTSDYMGAEIAKNLPLEMQGYYKN